MKTLRYYLSLYRLYRPGYGRIGALRKLIEPAPF